MADISTCICNPNEDRFDVYVVRKAGGSLVTGVIHDVKARIDSFLVELLAGVEEIVAAAATLQAPHQGSDDVIVVEYGHGGRDQALFEVRNPRRMLASIDMWENWLVNALVKLWRAFDESNGRTAFRLLGKEPNSLQLGSAA